MNSIHPDQLLESLRWRYAVKSFDPNRTVDSITWKAIEQSMVLAPSSYGLQPWKFLVVTSPKIKAQLPEISWNQAQPQDCSHMVVLAVRKSMDESYIDSYVQSIAETRSVPVEKLAPYRLMMMGTVQKMDSESVRSWNTRQVYIALGQLMTAAAVLGVDTCPMEGIDGKAYDRVLGLSNSDYSSVVGCAVGYRDAADKNALAKKVRFPTDDLVEYL
jgi:nitroreductase